MRLMKGSSCDGGVGILRDTSPSRNPVMSARLYLVMRASGVIDSSSTVVRAFVADMCIATLNTISSIMVAKGHSR